jgi:hypothetical protein
MIESKTGNEEDEYIISELNSKGEWFNLQLMISLTNLSKIYWYSDEDVMLILNISYNSLKI